MGLFDRFRKEKKNGQPPYLYDESEIRELDSFINDQFVSIQKLIRIF